MSMLHNAENLMSTLEAAQLSGVIQSEMRHKLIAEAAYYKAERRGFLPGFEAQDWEEAEREIDLLFADE